LENHSEKNSLSKQAHSLQYQIKASRFLAEKGEHQLLIMTDISQELHLNQKKSWQQLIRVLGHEIHNSLTSIKSLSQSLLMDAENSQKSLLEVIVERSDDLSDFVKGYSNLYKPYTIKHEAIHLEELFASLKLLFPKTKINLKLSLKKISADQPLLKQVLINLIKNAHESNLAKNKEQNRNKNKSSTRQSIIEVNCFQADGYHFISIRDQGAGIQNFDNLFVPFYTTKEKGQGIGLCFCRHIIELHEGYLSLQNCADKDVYSDGAKAIIQLPM